MISSIGVLLCALHCSALAVNTTINRYEKAANNNSRISPILAMSESHSRTECATMCTQTDACVAFNHNQRGTCELSRCHTTDNSCSTIHQTGWSIYSKHKERCWPSDHDGFVVDNTCYFWQQTAVYMNWSTAQTACGDHGAHLVCIESHAEGNALAEKVQLENYWTGLYRSPKDNKFRCNGRIPTFTNWGGILADDDCAKFWPKLGRKWYSQWCSLESVYICEAKWY